MDININTPQEKRKKATVMFFQIRKGSTKTKVIVQKSQQKKIGIIIVTENIGFMNLYQFVRVSLHLVWIVISFCGRSQPRVQHLWSKPSVLRQFEVSRTFFFSFFFSFLQSSCCCPFTGRERKGEGGVWGWDDRSGPEPWLRGCKKGESSLLLMFL